MTANFKGHNYAAPTRTTIEREAATNDMMVRGTRLYIYFYIHLHSQTDTQTDTHRQTHTYTDTHTHTRARAHTAHT